MHEFIQNILIYVVIITVLRGIITNDIYKQYFKFVSGLVMILLMMSPVLNFIYDDGEWYRKVEEVIIQSDIDDINDELKTAEGGFEDMLMKNCKSVIAEKVEKLAEKEGIVIGSVDVGIKNKNDEIDIYNIDVEIITDNKKDVSQKRDNGEKEIDRVTVDVINIGNERKIRKKEKLSDNELHLQSDICDYFILEKDRVTLWH